MADRRDRDRREMASTDEWLGTQQSSGGWLCLKIPAKAHRFQPKEAKTYLLDIYPFRAGKNHPNKAVQGKYVPDVMYQCHRMVGPNKDTVLCPGRTYHKRCFVCEYRAKMGAGPDRDAEVTKALKDLQPKDRQIYNVFDHDDKAKGWQIFEYSFFLFGKNIADKIIMSRPKDKERYKTYWHPGAKGMTLKLLGTEDTGPGGSKFINFSQVEFVERSPKLIARLDDLPEPWCCDSCIRETPFDEVKSMFLAVGGGDDEDDKDTDDDEDLMDDDTDDEEDGDEDEDVDEDDDGDEDGDEEEEDADEDEEEDDEEEVTTPPAFKGDRVRFRGPDGDKLAGKVVAVLSEAQKLKVKDADGEIYKVAYNKIISSKDAADSKPKKRRVFPD